MKNKVYQYVQEHVIKNIESQLEEMKKDPSQKFSWVKPWGAAGMPFNDNLGRYYTGINTLLLYKGGPYLTEKQIKDRGWKLKPNAEQHMVVFWKPIPKKKGKADNTEDDESTEMGEDKKNEKFIYMLRYYIVYHGSDIEGFVQKHHIRENKKDETLDEAQDHAYNTLTSYCEGENISLKVTESNQAFYRPSDDLIQVPELSQYSCASEFISTLAHESVHSTGATHRLARDIANHFGDKDYSKEELVAEIGASMYLAIMGIEDSETERNSIAYIQHWLEHLKEDVRLITYAAQRAQKAVNYILQYELNNPFEEDQDEYKAEDKVENSVKGF